MEVVVLGIGGDFKIVQLDVVECETEAHSHHLALLPIFSVAHHYNRDAEKLLTGHPLTANYVIFTLLNF